MGVFGSDGMDGVAWPTSAVYSASGLKSMTMGIMPVLRKMKSRKKSRPNSP